MTRIADLLLAIILVCLAELLVFGIDSRVLQAMYKLGVFLNELLYRIG